MEASDKLTLEKNSAAHTSASRVFITYQRRPCRLALSVLPGRLTTLFRSPKDNEPSLFGMSTLVVRRARSLDDLAGFSIRDRSAILLVPSLRAKNNLQDDGYKSTRRRPGV